METADTLADALDAGTWDLVLVADAPPTADAVAALLLIRGRGVDVPVIVVPGADKAESAVTALRAGACDYLVEPVPTKLLAAIALAAAARAARAEGPTEARFHAHLLDAVDQAVVATDLEGIIRYWSRSAERLYGWSATEVLGRCILDVELRDASFEEGLQIISMLREGKRSSQECTMRRRDGRTFPALLIRSPIFDEAGSLVGVIGVSSDITARVHAEKALRASETRFRGAFDGAVTAMSLEASSGQILQVNPSLCALLGYNEAELLSRDAHAITHPDDWAASEIQIRQLLDGEATKRVLEKRLLHRDNYPIWVQMSTSLQRDTAGRPLYIINQLQDITERMRLESDLHAREEQLRTIATNAPLIIYAADQDGTMTLCLGGGLRHSGVEADAYVGHPIREVFAHTPDMLDMIRKAYSGQAVTAMTDIGGRTFEAHWWPTRNASGVIAGVTGLAVDLTDRVRTEAEHARLAAIVTSSQDAIIGTTLDGIIESWNAGATRLYGYGPEETIGRSILLISPPDRIHEAPQVLNALRHGGATSHFVTVRLHKDGHAIDVAITLSATIDGVGAITGTASITRDITELKRALRDADLARSAAEELARVRNEHATEVEAMAQATIALSGALDPAELYVRILEHVARVVPCDLANVMLYQGNWAVVAASWGDERLMVGDKLFPLEGPDRLWAPEPQSGPYYLPDTADEPNWKDIPPRVGTRRIRSLISVPLLVDGTLLGSFDVGSVTAAAYSPRQIQIVAIFGERVVQALRNARLYAAERERARIAEDLAAMRSDFVAAVSHELRTPLTAVLGYAELLQGRWAHLSDTQRLDQIGRIVVSANRQHRLVADLLLISQIEDGVLSVRAGLVLLAGPIHGAAQEVRATYRDQQIQIEGPAALGVRADPDRLLQIVGNLLDNAAKYSPEGSPISVSWRAEKRWVTIQCAGPRTGDPRGPPRRAIHALRARAGEPHQVGPRRNGAWPLSGTPTCGGHGRETGAGIDRTGGEHLHAAAAPPRSYLGPLGHPVIAEWRNPSTPCMRRGSSGHGPLQRMASTLTGWESSAFRPRCRPSTHPITRISASSPAQLSVTVRRPIRSASAPWVMEPSGYIVLSAVACKLSTLPRNACGVRSCTIVLRPESMLMYSAPSTTIAGTASQMRGALA